MGKMKLADDEAIQHSLVSRALESAQKKIEGFHFDSRKQVLEYDNVLNQQRQSIYLRRRTVLMATGDALKAIIDPMANTPEATVLKEKMGDDAYYKTAQSLWLQINDYFWMNHLDHMDHLRMSVGLRGVGQRDPLVEYKREGLAMFKDLEHKVEEEFVRAIGHLQIK